MTLRRLRPLILLAGLLLAACTFQVNTTVTPSGAGELRSEIGFTQSDKDMLKTLDTSPEKFCDEAQTGGDLPAGSPVTLEERGDETWCVVTVPFKDLAELRTVAYDSMEGLTINELELTPTSFTYDVDIAFTGDQGSQLGADQAIFRWQVTAPGTITENNADEVDGNTLTWNLGIGESINVRVVSAISPVDALVGGSGLPGWVIPAVIGLCCCLLLLVAVVMVVVVVMRRRQADNPSPPAAM